MQTQDLDTLFILPLSQQDLEELDDLQNHLQVLPYAADNQDQWSPIWENAYTSRRFYTYIFSNVEAHQIFKEVWKSCCTRRVKFFAWLILVDRLNMKSMLRRRHLNIHDDDLCDVWLRRGRNYRASVLHPSLRFGLLAINSY